MPMKTQIFDENMTFVSGGNNNMVTTEESLRNSILSIDDVVDDGDEDDESATVRNGQIQQSASSTNGEYRKTPHCNQLITNGRHQVHHMESTSNGQQLASESQTDDDDNDDEMNVAGHQRMATTTGNEPAVFHFGPEFQPHCSTGPTSKQQASRIVLKVNEVADSDTNGRSDTYIVLFHVYPGVTIRFETENTSDVLEGPVTVPMVSTNSSPPIAMPVQVPPGHVVQQIVDENGTLRHVILSPQHSPGLIPLASHHTPHYGIGSVNGTNLSHHHHHHHSHHHHQQQQQPPQQPPQQTTFYQNLPTPFITPPHYHHCNLSPSHSVTSGVGNPLPRSEHSPPLNISNTYYKDERAQKQHIKLRKKIYDKQKKGEEIVCRNNDTNVIDATGATTTTTAATTTTTTTTTITTTMNPANAPTTPPKEAECGRDKSEVEDDIVATSEEDIADNSSSCGEDDEDDSIQTITDILSSIDPPKVSELTSRTALLQWAQPTRLKRPEEATRVQSPTTTDSPTDNNNSASGAGDTDDSTTDASGATTQTDPPESSSPTPPSSTIELPLVAPPEVIDICANEIRYEVLLSDKSKEMKFKSIYSGRALSCRIQDLRPGQEYSVCLQAHLDELQGSATDFVKFVTPPCEPDAPQSPKLHQRLKNSLQLRWNGTNDNGSPILNYVLEYDAGESHGDFVEFHRGRVKQFTAQKLQPGVAYRFRLCAVNHVGRSAYSDVVTYYTCQNAPLKPVPPQLVDATVDALHLRWERRPQDDDYVVQIMVSDLMANNNNYYLPVYNGRDTNCVCTNLAKFTEYKFRMRANNDGGNSPWSDEVAFRTLAARPQRPTKPVVKGRIFAHQFKLRWEPPTDSGGAEIDRYILELNLGSGYRQVYAGREPEALCDRLTPGTTYQLRVCCATEAGASNYSDPCTVTTDAICPGKCPAPRVVGKPKADSVVLRWHEPDYNGGAPVLEYELTMVAAATNERHTMVVHRDKAGPGAECYHTVCGGSTIQPGTQYHFSVRAINRIGPGAWSEVTRVTSGATAPGAMAVPQITCKTPFHIVLEWREPSCNGAAILEYHLEMAVDSSSSSSAAGGVNAEYKMVYQGGERSHHVRSLNPVTTYGFRVCAVNSAGTGAYSPAATLTTPAAPPAAVTALHAAATAPTAIQLQWQMPTHNGSPITHYNIDVGDGHLVTAASTVTDYQLVHLEPNTLYRVRVQAVNHVGNGNYSAPVRVVTPPLPPAPPKLECVGVGANYLKLKWGDGKNSDYIQYTLEMVNGGVGSGRPGHQQQEQLTFVGAYNGTALSHRVTRLQEEVTYRFRVNAASDAGVGRFSPVYEFTTSLAPPSPVKLLKVADVQQNRCTIDWTTHRNAFTDPVVYQVQLRKVKDDAFKQEYRQEDCKMVIDELSAGVEYTVRVCPIRVSANGDLFGSYSATLKFGTLPPETALSPKSSTHSNAHKKGHKFSMLCAHTWNTIRAKIYSDPPMFYSFLITVLGILLAILIILFL